MGKLQYIYILPYIISIFSHDLSYEVQFQNEERATLNKDTCAVDDDNYDDNSSTGGNDVDQCLPFYCFSHR